MNRAHSILLLLLFSGIIIYVSNKFQIEFLVDAEAEEENTGLGIEHGEKLEQLLAAQTCQALALEIREWPSAVYPNRPYFSTTRAFRVLKDFGGRSGLRAAFDVETGFLAFVGPFDQLNDSWTLMTKNLAPPGDEKNPPMEPEIELVFGGSNKDGYGVEGVFLADSNNGVANFVSRQIHLETKEIRYVQQSCSISKESVEVTHFQDIDSAQREEWKAEGIWPSAWVDFAWER